MDRMERDSDTMQLQPAPRCPMRSGRYRKAHPVYSGPWQRIRREILARDSHTCQVNLPGCTRHATTVDHITPISWGGEWYDPANLRAACAPCNTALGALAKQGKTQARAAAQNRPTPDGTSATPTRRW